MHLEFFRQPFIIIIHECNVVATRIKYSCISGCRHSFIYLVADILYSFVTKMVHDLVGVVFRGIVYNDNLKILKCLV